MLLNDFYLKDVPYVINLDNVYVQVFCKFDGKIHFFNFENLPDYLGKKLVKSLAMFYPICHLEIELSKEELDDLL